MSVINLSETDRALFRDQGYLVFRSLIDPERDLEPFRAGFARLLEGMADVLGGTLPEGAGNGLDESSIAARLAFVIARGGRDVIDHLEPVLSSRLSEYHWRADFPSAQFPELFGLARLEAVLDTLESLLGTEIICSPSCHMNAKLGRRERDLAAPEAAFIKETTFGSKLADFLAMGNTPWHVDADYALSGSRRIVVWIPVTSATHETGSLRVIPGSHKASPEIPSINDTVVAGAVEIPAKPGDAVMFDDFLLHGAGNNNSDQMRWAVSFRYRRADVPSDIIDLPSFVARSRSDPESELRNPELWREMWRHALAYAAASRRRSKGRQAGPGVGAYPTMDRATADALRARWNARIATHADWLSLGDDDVSLLPNAWS